MFTRYQICRYLNCMHNLIIYVGFSLRVDRVVSQSLLFTLQFSPCIMCSVPWGVILSTVGGIMMHVGDNMSTVGGKIFTIVTPTDPSGTVWSVIHVWDPPLKQLPSQQQIHWHYLGLRMEPI